MIKTAVIGVGNMGSRYALLIHQGLIEGLELTAVTRINEIYSEVLKPVTDAGVPVYGDAGSLLDAVESGELDVDAVVIATPHYSHEELAVRAFESGLHVLCEKPAGVYSRQARCMEDAAKKAGTVYGLIFNQRTLPVYKMLHKLVKSGKYGAVKRVNWVITDWYRPDSYYNASAWRGTWKGDGGGVLLNQCPHNLDLLQWICGMPSYVQGFCKEGHYHDIEVEDAVTAYMEWDSGASGTFVTSTGEAPGINRLEISMDEALICCDKGKLTVVELESEIGMKEIEYRHTSSDMFAKLYGHPTEIETGAENEPYRRVLSGFADEITGRGYCVAPGTEGRKSLAISNAIYLSSWERRMVHIPEPGSDEEREFEEAFEQHLRQRQ